MKVKRVEHIGIVVKSIEEVLPFYNLLGLKVNLTEEVPEVGLKIAFLPAGESSLELLQPTREDSSQGRFLKEKGEGMHHLCLRVEDIDEAIEELLAAGYQMVDQTPRSVFGGKARVAFVHPNSTHGVRLELWQE
ncbi:MAG: methylmalonyl-CoA epimerase [Actinobacteria bacterium]|nr:methylmalonyl-CoA epimerase [Actinomycetota bacterium]